MYADLRYAGKVEVKKREDVEEREGDVEVSGVSSGVDCLDRR